MATIYKICSYYIDHLLFSFLWFVLADTYELRCLRNRIFNVMGLTLNKSAFASTSTCTIERTSSTLSPFFKYGNLDL